MTHMGRIGYSLASSSEPVSYNAMSYTMSLYVDVPSLSEKDEKKLEYALKKHKRGLELLSQ